MQLNSETLACCYRILGERLHSLNAVVVGNAERKAGKRNNNNNQQRLPTSSTTSLMYADLASIEPSSMPDIPTLGNTTISSNNAAGNNCTTVIYATTAKEDRVVVNYVNEWISAYAFLAQNQEKFYLYVIVSVTAGVLLLLGLVIGRLLLSRHRAKRDAKFHANNETLPNGFTDDISEIDADIDLTTPVPVPMQDTRLPETQLAERLHGDRYYSDARIPLSPGSVHSGHSVVISGQPGTGVRVDLGNHMVGTDSLHTILRPESSRAALAGGKPSYYYG